jgi:undecaprenyl pyrophosphate phosphatase UppP
LLLDELLDDKWFNINIMLLFVALLFVVIGVLIKYGKMYYLIAGYNTMSPKQQAEYNIEKIATLFRNVTFTMAAIVIVGYTVNLWLNESLVEFVTILVAVLVGIPFLLIKSNSEKYKNRS